jgi:hypothetical protein
MPRITERDLDGVCETIRKATGNDSYRIAYAYGRPRLERAHPTLTGAIEDISPRLPKPALYDWLWAYLDGIREGCRIAGKES